jgi:hypothetical protein
MKTDVRVLVLLAILAGMIGLARQGEALTPPGMASAVPAQAEAAGDDHGTVKPPPKKVKACRRGTYSVGGEAILKVKRLAPHYCVQASLRHRNEVWGNIPAGAGKILADLTLFQVIYKHHPVKSLPASDGHVELCYAVPPGKNAGLYYLDKHHVWTPLETTFKKGAACARIRTSGYYALIGK